MTDTFPLIGGNREAHEKPQSKASPTFYYKTVKGGWAKGVKMKPVSYD
jgi:hypothetical protein